MKKSRLIMWILCVLAISGWACDRFILVSKDDLSKDENEDGFYFNSFETDEDIHGWQGAITLRDEAAPDGGQRSLFASGGCVVPHNSLEITVKEDSYFVLRCWGKNLEMGGSVILTLEGEDIFSENSIHVNVDETEWTAYESRDRLFCPANRKLKLSLNAGGFVPSSMLVDLLEIEKVD